MNKLSNYAAKKQILVSDIKFFTKYLLHEKYMKNEMKTRSYPVINDSLILLNKSCIVRT